jgi:hypothetical protein
MAVVNLDYLRRFEGVYIEKGLLSYFEPNEEDEKIRREMSESFGHPLADKNFTGSREMFGFDGELSYFFSISDNLSSIVKPNTSYIVEVHIAKLGKMDIEHSLSDLEIFLSSKKFQKKLVAHD